MLPPKTGKSSPIGALAVEVYRQDGAKACSRRTIQDPLHCGGVQIEGRGVDVGQHGSGSGAENRADRGEEAERGGDDSLAGADPGGGKGQPECVGAGGAAKSMSHAQLPGRGPLKGGYRLAKDELLRLKHLGNRIQEFLMERDVLALEVQHGYGLGGLGGSCMSGAGVLHVMMVPAAESCWSQIEDWIRGLPGLRRHAFPGRAKSGTYRKRISAGIFRRNAVFLTNPTVPCRFPAQKRHLGLPYLSAVPYSRTLIPSAFILR